MARRKDPALALLGVGFGLLGAVAKAASAAEKARAKQEKENSRREKANIKLENARLKAQFKQEKETQKKEQDKERDRLKEVSGLQKKMQSEMKMNSKKEERERLQEERNQLKEEQIKANEMQKQLILEQKRIDKETLELFSQRTIKKYNLEIKNLISTKLDRNKNILSLISKLSKESDKKALEKIQESKISLDEFIWSGNVNSVLGPNGLIQFKNVIAEALTQNNHLDVTHNTIAFVFSTGIYLQTDFTNRNDMKILNQWRCYLRSGSKEATIDNIDEVLKSYIEKTAEKIIFEINALVLNYKTTKWVA
jgi:hypothetical protein